jgi:hypothetical protein
MSDEEAESNSVSPVLKADWFNSCWGREDQRGNGNLMTRDKVLEVVKLIKTGEIVSLGMPYDAQMPIAPGRAYALRMLGGPTGGPCGDKSKTILATSAVGVHRAILERIEARTSRPTVAPFRRRHPAHAQRADLDVAIAEREMHIEPNDVPDNRRGKLVAGKRDHHPPPTATRYRCRDRAARHRFQASPSA